MASEQLLALAGIHVDYPVGGRALDRLRGRPQSLLRAVDGVDLELARGEALGLVGESGSGKTTLARVVVGLQEPTAGVVRFEGQTIEGRRPPALARRIAIVFQDPYASLDPRMTVRQALSELVRAHRLVPRAGVEERCRELVSLVGLAPSSLDAYPHQFSGGQRQRIAIARALALEPDILVADEPVSALDVSVQVTVLRLLADLRSRLGLTMLLISHDLAVVQHLCDRVAVMYLGRIVEQAPVDLLFGDPRHPYTRSLLAAVPRLGPPDPDAAPNEVLPGEPPSPVDLPSGCRFHPRCPIAQPICSELDPALSSDPAGAPRAAACHFAWPEPAAARGASPAPSPPG
jgi:oligopeptide/dipeptide ABC transporter ATP-binding protein